MENSFFTSSPSPRADLMGGMVPVETRTKERQITKYKNVESARGRDDRSVMDRLKTKHKVYLLPS